MTEIRIKTPPSRPKSWLRKLVRIALVLLLLLIAFYFVVTSSIFLTKVVLPQVGKALKAELTATELQVSPFSKVVIRNLKLQPQGNETLVTIKEVRARYSLLSILRGNIEVSEIVVDSPTITIVEDADGRSNLDSLASSSPAKPGEKPVAKPAATSVPQVDIKLVSLNNATVKFTKKHLNGASDVVAVSGVNFKLQDLKNGQAGKLELTLAVAADQAARLTNVASALQAKLDGQFNFSLASDLKPTTIKGGLSFAVQNATGAWADLNALAAKLDCDTTATEVKQISLRFNKAEVALGEVRIAGPFDLVKQEGKLKLEVLSLDRRVLNLAGAASGLDFGTTTINASTDIELLRAGKAVSIGGRLDVARLQLVQQGRTSPTLDIRCDYAALIDNAAQTAELRFLNLSGAQNGRTFLQSELPQSFTVALGQTATTAGDATFNLSVTDFNLADWREFLGDKTFAGKASGKLQVAASQGGKQLRVELTGALDKLSATAGSNRVDKVDGRLATHVSVTDLKAIKLEDFRFEILHAGQAALVTTASGAVQGDSNEADLQVSVQATLAQLLAAMHVPGLTASSGTFTFQTHVQQKDAKQTVTGKVVLADFAAKQGDLQLAGLGTDFDFELAASAQGVDIQKLTGVLRMGDKPGGRIDAGGKIELAGAGPSGQIILKVSDVNQELLRPFVATALGDKKLVSIAIGAAVTLDLESSDKLKLVADTSVTNLVVSDPQNPALATPLQLRLQADVGLAKQITQINQCRLTLTPTDRAKNELNLTGMVDSSKPDAITGNLKLTAAALDFTRYYDLLSAKPPAEPVKPGGKPTPAPTSPASKEPAQEPEPVKLPFQNFTGDIEIGHLYLHEVDISNWRSTAKISGSQFALKPCQFAINGGPVDISVDADLGVPGYRYAVGFNAKSVPLAPLVNTFATDRAGQIGGQLMAHLDLKGAGVTGTSLQTNLVGQFNLLTTNMNLSINNVRTPILNAIVNTIIGLPDLIAGLTGKRDAGQMKWADEITAKPIDVLLVTGTAGSGKVELKEAQVHSAAFEVQCDGEIELAPITDDSTLHFPVHVALGRPYATKLGMVNADTPTNAAYILLPDFLTIKGTLGKVDPNISKTGLLKVAGKAVGGLGKETGKAIGEAGKSIYGATSVFLKDKFSSSDTNSATGTDTNTAAAPKKKSGFFNLFRREKKE